jgi:hypothetical protein
MGRWPERSVDHFVQAPLLDRVGEELNNRGSIP